MDNVQSFEVFFMASLSHVKLKEYKYTQPLIGMPEPLPETGVLANQKPRKSDILTESQSDRVTKGQTRALYIDQMPHASH